jgi:signal transduction histidine kinase
VTTTAAIAGWLMALGLGWLFLRARMRVQAIADAAHELRGSAAALALVAASIRRQPGGLRHARAFESELDRLSAGLADLDAARTGTRVPARASVLPLERALRTAAAGWRPVAGGQGRRVTLRWEAGTAAVRVDRRRLAQVLGNLLANAVEHGTGVVSLRGRRRGDAVVVEVVDQGPRPGSGDSGPDRGRGLAIAARAAEEAGGRLTVTRTREGTAAAIELPVAES